MLTAKFFISQKIRWLAITLMVFTMGAGALLFATAPGAVYAAGTVNITTSSLPAGTAGEFYSETLTATGGSGSYSWTQTGGSLPSGLTLATTGIVSGNATTAGNYSFTVEAADSANATNTATGNVTLTINPNAIAKYAVSTISSPQQAGTLFNVTLQAQDQYSNNITSGAGAAENINVTFGQADSQAIVNGNTTASGQATVSLTLKKAATGQEIIFTGANSGKSGTSNRFDVDPGPATGISMTGYPATVAAGTSHTFTVTAEDAYGNTATSYAHTIAFTSSDSQAVLPSNATLNSGTGNFTATLKTAGTQSITATDTSNLNTAIENNITVDPGPTYHYTVSAISSPEQAGTSFNVTIQAQDQYSNNITSGADAAEQINVIFAQADSQATPTSTTTVNGAATVSLTLKKATAGQQVTFTGATSLKSGVSTSFTVDPGPAASLSVTGYPASVTVDTSHTFTVTAQDAYGNTATSYAGTVNFTSSDSQAVLPSGSNLTNGTGTFDATLQTAGTQSITATDTVTSSITGTESGIVVNAVSSGATQSKGQVTYGLPAPVTLPLNVNGSQGNLTLSTQMTTEGKVNLNSQDNKVSLTIPTGTLIELNGQAPTSISLTPASSTPPLPQGESFVGLPLDCQPDGLVFDPGIKMVWHIGALPANVKPDNVRVAYYDHTANEWVNVPATYDQTTGDITATINHFTSYAVYVLESQAPATTAPTATASATPTATATATPSATPTVTTTLTAPATATATATPTPTASVTPTATATAPTSPAPAAATSTFNWGMLIGVVAGVVIILVILLWTTRKWRG